MVCVCACVHVCVCMRLKQIITFVNLKNFWENRESLSSETKNFTRKFIQAIFLDFSIRFKCVCFFFATGSSVGIFFKWIPMHALSQKFYECNKI